MYVPNVRFSLDPFCLCSKSEPPPPENLHAREGNPQKHHLNSSSKLTTSGTKMTGRPGDRTMETNGGSTASYLACTLASFKSWFLGSGFGQQLFGFRSWAVHWMARISSLNCLSCRNPYQTAHSLKASRLFTENPFFFTKMRFVASPSQKSAPILVFLLIFIGLEAKGAFRLPGATRDHFRCMVELSPGRVRCRQARSIFDTGRMGWAEEGVKQFLTRF